MDIIRMNFLMTRHVKQKEGKGLRREHFVCIVIALCVGVLFSFIGVPAGFLIGGLVVGISYGLFLRPLSFSGMPFRFALGYVGVNVGFMMEPELFRLLLHYFLPLLISLTITLLAGVGIGWLLYRWTDLDPLTAYFSTVPGGASEVIAFSGEYGADNRIVAAFHTARITLFVMLVPFLASVFYPGDMTKVQGEPLFESISIGTLIGFFVAILLAIILFSLWKLPAGTLFYGVFAGFVMSEWILTNAPSIPTYIAGIGQALIGVMVGVRFDRSTFLKLKEIGVVSALLLAVYFLFSLVNAAIFHWLTDLPYMTSLLSTAPAGAAEMSSTAMALHLEPTLVSSLHIIRVIALFLFLPIVIHLLRRFSAPK